MDSLADQECSHVIQTKQEYETLLRQRDRAKREKEEAERTAAREISRVKQETAHEADRAAQRAQAQIDDLLQHVERKTAEIADQRALNAPEEDLEHSSGAPVLLHHLCHEIAHLFRCAFLHLTCDVGVGS